MIYLPDVNVWIALAIAEHVHHKPAQGWFDSSEGGVVFCRVTQMGLLRILTNQHALGTDALTPAHAWAHSTPFSATAAFLFPMSQRDLIIIGEFRRCIKSKGGIGGPTPISPHSPQHARISGPAC